MRNDLTIEPKKMESHFIEELSVILKSQIAICRQLIDLSKFQTKELVRGKAMETGAVSIKMGEKLKQLALAEKKRKSVIVHLAEEYHIEGTFDLVNLIKTMNLASPDFLLTVVQDLESCIDELKTYSQKNKILLAQAMKFIDFNINVLASTIASITYVPKGRQNSGFNNKKIFDQSI